MVCFITGFGFQGVTYLPPKQICSEFLGVWNSSTLWSQLQPALWCHVDLQQIFDGKKINKWVSERGFPRVMTQSSVLFLLSIFWVIVANHGWSEDCKVWGQPHAKWWSAIWRVFIWFLVPLPCQPRYPLLPFLCVFFLQLLKAGLCQNHSCARLVWLISGVSSHRQSNALWPPPHTLVSAPSCLPGSRVPQNTTRAPDCPRIRALLLSLPGSPVLDGAWACKSLRRE